MLEPLDLAALEPLDSTTLDCEPLEVLWLDCEPLDPLDCAELDSEPLDPLDPLDSLEPLEPLDSELLDSELEDPELNDSELLDSELKDDSELPDDELEKLLSLLLLLLLDVQQHACETASAVPTTSSFPKCVNSGMECHNNVIYSASRARLVSRAIGLRNRTS